MQDEKSLQRRERDQPAAPDILYGSIDAAKVRIEPRDAQEKVAENRETWRDLKAGCWYEGEVVPVRQQSTRQKDKAQREGVVLRARNKKYFCDIAKAKETGKLLWATSCAAGADRARLLVFICDGADALPKSFFQFRRTPNLAQTGDGRLMARKSRIGH